MRSLKGIRVLCASASSGGAEIRGAGLERQSPAGSPGLALPNADDREVSSLKTEARLARVFPPPKAAFKARDTA
jgi:hypothetical protein